MGITEDQLKKANEKLNEFGRLVADSLGLGAKVGKHQYSLII